MGEGVVANAMVEGWYNKEHFVLFGASEQQDATRRYDLSQFLPGYKVLGLRGWDDFILQDGTRTLFTCPTVPIDAKRLRPLSRLPDADSLELDKRFEGRIKWYIQPVIFGGDPTSQKNMAWLSRDQHAEAVIWWNRKYREVSGQGGSRS
jgi:hypothetical protein